jgi:hypothetical protein
MKYGEDCERMEQENGRKEKQKTVITLRMSIRHDDGRDGRDNDDSNNSNPYKSKGCCSKVMYIIRYLFIGAEDGNIDRRALLGIT